jgi:transcription elongation factor Elf1
MMKNKVECVECGGRMKVELVSQNGEWVYASCPICGHDISIRPNPGHARTIQRRRALDRIAFVIIIVCVAILSVVLIHEVTSR